MSVTLRILPAQYGTELRVKMGDGPAKLIGPVGWTAKHRQGQVGLASWNGMEPVQQEVPILIDRFGERRGVEFEVDHLRQIAGVGRKNFDGWAPTAVRVRGPIHFPGKRWVITEIDETEVIRLPRNLGGNITRYQATLKLMEYIHPDQIRLRRRRTGRRVPFFYTVRQGDTLARIAQRVYRDRSKWRRIGNAQSPKIRDPRKRLRAGRKLRIPDLDGRLQ